MSNEEQTNSEDASKFKAVWLEPSPIGEEYMRHERAMLPAASVPVHKAFAIAPGFNVGMLQRMAEAYKPKKIVVVDHGEAGFEIRRLSESADVKMFYASLVAKASEIFEVTSEEAKRNEILHKLLARYFEVTDEELSKYDPKSPIARAGNCVSYTYIQRKIAAVATFRNNVGGGTKAIKASIEVLEAEGVLRRLSEDEGTESFGSLATFYRVNRAAIKLASRK